MRILGFSAVVLILLLGTWFTPSGLCAEAGLIQEIKISTAKIEPGHVLAVAVRCPQPGLSVDLGGLEQKVRLAAFPSDPLAYVGYLAVPLEAAPRTETLNVSVQNGSAQDAQAFSVEILAPSPRRVERLHIRNYSELRFAPESRVMAAARAQSALRLENPLGQFSPPLPGGKSNDNFGVKRVYLPSKQTSVHRGVDIDAPQGTDIVAPADGVVLLARKFKAHGNTVLVDHGLGVVTTYLHQSRILAKPGQKLKTGQALGRVGSTGASTGPHLHFQINVHGVVVDPDDFLKSGPEARETVFPMDRRP